MSMTLDDLLRSLEKQASDKEDKADESKEDKKTEDKAEAKETKAGDKLKSAEKDLEDAKKMEERVKEASLQGEALAKEIMQKVASAATPTINKEDKEMNKSASVAGKTLAQSLLEKLAGAGDQNTADGISGAVPNKAQIDNAAMVAQGEATVDPTPTKDAVGNGGGSVNQIFDAIIAKAVSQGAASVDQVHTTGVAPQEGVIEGRVTPETAAGGASDEVEKAAAVSALVGSGFDFASAVDMVKAAEQEILAEQDLQVKQAAMGELLASGVDFALAAALVKQASMAKAVGGEIKNAVAAARNLGKAPRMAGEALMKNRAIQGAAAGAAAGAAGAALAREKKAALDGLLDAGMDFDTAVQMVAETSKEIYGA